MPREFGSPIYKCRAKFEHYVMLTASAPTSVRYSKALKDFFARFPDKRDASEFCRADIEDYKMMRTKDGLSAKSINYNLQILKAFFNYMIDSELAKWNPVSKVRRLKEVEPKKVSLTLEEQNKVYASVAVSGSLHDKLLVGLALGTGLRAETLHKLELADVDYEGCALRIPAEKMKAARSHDVPIRETELALIRELSVKQYLFEGYANSPRMLSLRFNRILRRAGVSLRGLRLARRTFATTLVRAGVDLKTVQSLMAHQNIATTSLYLTPADEKVSREAISRLPTGANA